MDQGREFEKITLLFILVAELLIFTGSFDKFFNHDSLFYLVHPPRSWDEFQKLLTSPDPTQQYRPLTLGAMALVVPYFGLDHHRYHLIPVLFHLVNTILFYRLTRRLVSGSPGVLVATGFWALHSVAGWITYGITYISDFMMATFVLGSLNLAVDGQRTGSGWRQVGAMLLCVAALLTKEAAVVFPLALLLSLVLASLREGGGAVRASVLWQSLRRAAPLTGICLLICLAQAGLMFYWLQQGKLYAQSTSAAYAIDPLGSLLQKSKYLFWSLNLPESLSVAHPNRTRALALLLMGIPLILWGADIARRRGRLLPLEWGGLIWLLGMNLPAFMLSHRLAKWYLYVPVMGLALAIGSAAVRLRLALSRLPAKGAIAVVVAIFLLPSLYSTAVQTWSFLRSSDSSYASRVVESCLRDFQKAHPQLPSAITLYVLPTFEKNVSEFFAGGKLYELFYPGTRVQMLFADRGDSLPGDFAERPDLLVLRYLYGHVYDETGHYKGRRLDAAALPLITSLEKVGMTVSRDEFYPSYDEFGTPGGTPVFFATPDREILSQIGGSTAVVPLGTIPARASLHTDISWMHDEGDGGWAELRLQRGAQEAVHYRRYFQPNPRGQGLSWENVRVDLSAYEGQSADLILKCYNNPGNTTIADWLNWRRLALEAPPHEPMKAMKPTVKR